MILCSSLIMFSFSKENDRILEIKALYSKIINDSSYKTDTVIWSVSENEYSSPLERTFVYSYFENNLSKLICYIKQDDFVISSEYYFEDKVLFFAFLTYDFGSEKEENRMYFNTSGGIEKLLVNYGNGNKEIKDKNTINSIKESTLKWLEKGNAKLENREKLDKETLNIQLNDSKVIIEKKSDLEEEKNLIAENDFDWYDKLPLPKWYKNLTLDDKPAPKWLFYWSIFLFIFLLFRNIRKENKKIRKLEKRELELQRQENLKKRERKEKRKKEEFELQKQELEWKKQELEWKKMKDKNQQETGFRETNKARINREKGEASIKRENEKKKQLADRFGIEDGEKIYNKEIWQGMTLEMLQLCKGFPGDSKKTVYKKITKKKYFYEPYENRQKNINYRLRVDLENDVVVGFKDL